MVQSAKQERCDDIDGLRAVALLCIVFYHAGFFLARGFFIGVDIFFVISGYFIALGLLRDLDRESFSLGGFYLRRAWRIIPPLAGVALCCIIPAYLWATPPDFIQFGKTLLSVVTFVSNYFFYSQGGYFDAPLEDNPFLPTWFLSVQVQFYTIFPLVFRLVARRFPKKILFLVTASLLLSLGLSEFSVRHLPTAAYFLLFSRFWELLLGSLIAILCHRKILRPAALPRWAAECLGWGAVAAIALCGLTYDPGTAFPGFAALPVCLGAALLIVLPYSAGQRLSVNALLSLRPLVFIGLISYSVYLWHWPIFVYFKTYLMVETLPRKIKFLAILCSFAMGLLSWALLERGLGNARGIGKKTRMGILLTPVVVAALLLAVLFVTSGMPNRFPHAAQPCIAVLAEAEESAVAGAAVQINDVNPQAVEQVRRGDLHVLGKKTQPDTKFLAWGDSHMYHLGTLLDKISDDLSVQGLLLTTPGHPPLLDVYRSRWDATDSQRESYMNMTRAAVELIREKHIPIALLSCYWWFYPNQDLTAPAPEESGSNPTGFSALRHGFHTTVAALEEAGCEVWIVRPIPFYPVSVPLAMMRTLRAGESQPPHVLRLSVTNYADKNADVLAILNELAERHPNVRFIDPVPQLCPDGRCLSEIDNRPLYFDDNHLSKFGSLYLEPAFADFITALEKHLNPLAKTK